MFKFNGVFQNLRKKQQQKKQQHMSKISIQWVYGGVNAVLQTMNSNLVQSYWVGIIYKYYSFRTTIAFLYPGDIDSYAVHTCITYVIRNPTAPFQPHPSRPS